jgi:hypothetical protein
MTSVLSKFSGIATEGKKPYQTKCLQEMRQTLVKDILSACGSSTICAQCHQPRLKIRQENFRKLYFERSSRVRHSHPVV